GSVCLLPASCAPLAAALRAETDPPSPADDGDSDSRLGCLVEARRSASLEMDVDGQYRRYGPMVLRRCRRLVGDEAKALDAMHDVFVQLLQQNGQVKVNNAAALLHRIATNVCLNRLRGERRRRPESAEEELLLSIANSDDLERRSLARVAIDLI